MRSPSQRSGEWYATPYHYLLQYRERRERLRKLGKCINGPPHDGPGRFGTKHGPPNPESGKCSRCEAVARVSRFRSRPLRKR